MNRRGFLIGLMTAPAALAAATSASQAQATQQQRPTTLEEALADPTRPGQPDADYVYRMRRYRRGGRTGGFWRNAVLRARRRRGR